MVELSSMILNDEFIFQKRSAINRNNRSKYSKELMARTGSKPFRQIIWKEMVGFIISTLFSPMVYMFLKYLMIKHLCCLWKGGKEGNKPKLVDVFYTTRKKGDELPNVETKQKYVC